MTVPDKADLPIQSLSDNAKKVKIFHNIQSSSLLSIGQLCNDNYIAVFHKHALAIIKIMQLFSNVSSFLWDALILPKHTIPKFNGISNKNLTKQQFTAYYHSCAFSP